MNESTTPTTKQFTGCASLAAIGMKLRELKLFEPIEQTVQIAQKIIKDRPTDKLYDALISMLAGAHGLVEINTRLRADVALQRAFGRSRCAEQSVVQNTLDACSAENVAQMEQAMDTIYRQHSQGYQHDYQARYQVLDVDMSGMPCGPKAAFASKGYFAKQRNRRGRQLGRVLATGYEEVVVDRLFDGKTQLTKALQPLMQAAEQTLELDERTPWCASMRAAGAWTTSTGCWCVAIRSTAKITPALALSAWQQAYRSGSMILRERGDRSAG